MVPFESGVHYRMEWTEAAHRSAQSGEVVYHPAPVARNVPVGDYRAAGSKVRYFR